MKVFKISHEQVVPRPLREVFSFFECPENLSRMTPPSVGFVILTPSPITMTTGAVIDYTIRVFGLRQHWRTLISDYQPPHRFVDVQLKGPYLFWHHTHSFDETEKGTVIRDEVRYALPFGPLGRLMHTLIVRKQLDRIFHYRADAIRNVFETGK